jgi:hypothetical protein
MKIGEWEVTYSKNEVKKWVMDRTDSASFWDY